MSWIKDSPEQRQLDRLCKDFKPLIPKKLHQEAKPQQIPNRSTHLGRLIELAVAKGMTLKLVKED